jgi:glycosyltransferase involved in cell wall biosynthesis
MPGVPVRHLDRLRLGPDDIVVLPEGLPKVMHALKNAPCRRFAIALNWHYVFNSLPDGVDWRAFNIERILTVSPEIARMLGWAMGLPTHVLASSIDHGLYYRDSLDRKAGIVFIARKSRHADLLKRILAARNPDYAGRIQWSGLDGLPEAAYADRLRRAAVFLNLSMAEGFPTSCLEAMAAGTLVAGYDSVGGRDILIGEGSEQNCLLAPMGDYVTLAYTLEPVLDSLLGSAPNRWNAVVENAAGAARGLTEQMEAEKLVDFWSSVCSRQALPSQNERASC